MRSRGNRGVPCTSSLLQSKLTNSVPSSATTVPPPVKRRITGISRLYYKKRCFEGAMWWMCHKEWPTLAGSCRCFAATTLFPYLRARSVSTCKSTLPAMPITICGFFWPRLMIHLRDVGMRLQSRQLSLNYSTHAASA